MSDDLRLWVIDTSTLIAVRQLGVARRKQEAIFRKLTALVENQQLTFPPQVLEELEWAEREHPDDLALAWARAVRERASQHANLETVRKVLARAPNLIDADSEREQADPYVIALALDSSALGGTSILSNDYRDRSDGRGGFKKLSIATVAGALHITVVAGRVPAALSTR